MSTFDDLEARIDALVKMRRLDVEAWQLADDVETAMWYGCRAEPPELRDAAVRLARLIVLGRLVGLSGRDAALLRVPENLHGIFMRAELPDLQRSRRRQRSKHRAENTAAHQGDVLWPPASVG